MALHEDGSASFVEKPEPDRRAGQWRLLLLPPAASSPTSPPTDACVLEQRAAGAADRRRPAHALQPRRLLVLRRHAARPRGGAGPVGGRRRALEGLGGQLHASDLPAPAGHAGPAGRAAGRPARLFRPLLLPRPSSRSGASTRASSRPISPSRSVPAPCAGCTIRSGPAPRPRWSPACRARSTTWSSTCAPNSPTFGEHAVVELSGREQAIAGDPARLRPRVHDPRERHALLYMVSSAYDPTRERAVRWDDPGFAI